MFLQALSGRFWGGKVGPVGKVGGYYLREKLGVQFLRDVGFQVAHFFRTEVVTIYSTQMGSQFFLFSGYFHQVSPFREVGFDEGRDVTGF